MSSSRDAAGFWLLFACAVVTLILFSVASVVVISQVAVAALRWNHLVVLLIFALLMAMMVCAILKARQSD